MAVYDYSKLVKDCDYISITTAVTSKWPNCRPLHNYAHNTLFTVSV